MKCYEITLKNGKTYNTIAATLTWAFDNIKDYLFCEYNERLIKSDIVKIDVYPAK